MSTILGNFKIVKITVWTEGDYDADNPYSSGYGSPVTFDGRYMNSGQISRNDEGAEFMPSMTIVTKYASLNKDDRVAIGTFEDATPVATAETIIKVETGTALIGTPDYKVLT